MDGAGPWGRERSLPHWIPSGGRHPGFRECVALRGAMQERGPWSVHEDGGSIQPSGQRIDDDCNEGCSRSSCEEGNLHPRLTAAAEGVREGPSLRAPRLVQSSAIVQSRRRLRATPRPDHRLRRWSLGDSAGLHGPSSPERRILPQTACCRSTTWAKTPLLDAATRAPLVLTSSTLRTEGWMLPPSSRTDQGPRSCVAPRRATFSRKPGCLPPLGIW